MNSWQLNTLNFILKNPLKRFVRLKRDLNLIRQSFHKSSQIFRPLKSVLSKSFDLDGMSAEWIQPRIPKNYNDFNRNHAHTIKILYLHGGGYCLGSMATHNAYLTYFSHITKSAVLSINYRLAPENPYPAALEDSLKAYRYLLQHRQPHEKIIIAGESAGGGLCIATLMAIRDQSLPMPDAGICLSPWLDLTQSGDSVHYNRLKDRLLTIHQVNDAAELYYGDDDPTNPFISPLNGCLHGLPPLFIQTSQNELFLSDALALQAVAKKYDVPVTLEIWNDVPHAWPYFAPMLPEARSALRHVSRFIEQVQGQTNYSIACSLSSAKAA